MILVNLPLPETETPDISGEITIVPDETDVYVKELGITVYWPEDTTGLEKQVSIDNGKTYYLNDKEYTLREIILNNKLHQLLLYLV